MWITGLILKSILSVNRCNIGSERIVDIYAKDSSKNVTCKRSLRVLNSVNISE